jgi:phytoene synthase
MGLMTNDLIESFPTVQRLALAYAPAAARPYWLALLALDSRLAAVIREAREPILGQLRLAWWRDRLREDPTQWPRGEPLLALLATWQQARAGLVGLVDGWEAMLGEAPLPAEALSTFAAGRGQALGALAGELGQGGDRAEAERAGAEWTLAELSTSLSAEAERHTAAALLAGRDLRTPRLPRVMRPLTVLHGLAVRTLERGAGAGAMLTALRLGIFGR